MWPGANPLGKRLRVGGIKGPNRVVIGVTGNVRHRGLDATTTLQWYVPEHQWLEADNQSFSSFALRAIQARLRRPSEKQSRRSTRRSPIINVATMDQVIATSTTQRRLALVLFGAFAVAALLLSVAGIYGVLAGSVAERTREIGVRSALGATPANIVGLIVRQGGRLSALGILLGLAGSLAVTRYLRTLLFGIGPNDPATLVGVAMLLGLVTLLACLIPGTRAARVDPSRALQSE
jgi:ABC-type antimicrobial peptide transport system permease subunit